MEDPGLLTRRRLTADIVRETMFSKSRFGGLDAGEVTRFMHEVARELDLCDDERHEMAEEIGQLRELNERMHASQLANGAHDGPPRVEQQAISILARAQDNADRLLRDAQQQARDLVGSGRHQRDGMLADGRARAARVIDEAVDEAGRQAARIAAEAPVQAQRQLAYYSALAESVRATLNGHLAALQAAVARFEEEERQGRSAIPGPEAAHA